MDTQLQGKAALITGGATGIGRGIALALAEEGVDLAIAGRNPDPVAIEEMRSRGVRCIAIRADVSREDETVRMVREALAGLGNLDIYVNNAAGAWHRPVMRLDTKSWSDTINTNLSACMWACREVCAHMIRRKSGSILIIGSTARFNPSYRETAYRISKTGLRSLMESLAIEMAPYAIRVNMITPGHFRTRLTSGTPPATEDKVRENIPLRRFGDTAEIGRAAVMLLSDRLSGYTTGADLVIDGGMHLRPLPLLADEEIYRLNLPLEDHREDPQ